MGNETFHAGQDTQILKHMKIALLQSVLQPTLF